MSDHSFVFSEKPIRIERGEGVFLHAADGTEYLDLGASYACTPAGHCHPEVLSRTKAQLEELFYVQASYPHDQRDELYAKLAATAPGDVEYTWLCNSGTEANEAALKFARSATGRSKIIATTRGFHGRTMGALACTWKGKYKEPFEPLIDDVEFVPYGDTDAMREAVDQETAAVILEPLQGEGGINPASTEYLQAVRVATATNGVAMVMDEIQTGLGRTGEFWASDGNLVVPDILTTAKGLANGLPIGATLCREWVAEGSGPHGSTFSGGPAICAAANATLDVIHDEGLTENAAEVGEYLRSELEASVGDEVRDIRGNGLMVGVEVKRGANRMLRDLALNHQVLALPAGRTVVRLLPPITLSEAEADLAVDAITEVVTS
jgi:acetylornithine/LysW-gamma-L-lysine aminotransferase